jgi:hypothetical protein
MDATPDDVRAIEEVVARQFASLGWDTRNSADWQTFARDFFPEASLYAAARPARRQSVAEFMERMKGIAGTKLRSFRETVLGTEIRVFGNVAVAVAACEMTENESEINRGIEMLLLVKTDGRWMIVSQAWDTETPQRPIPAHLRGTAAAARSPPNLDG